MEQTRPTRTIYEREKLYDEVWQEPVVVVARRYGISNIMVKKICRRLKVPVPPLGYWAKLRAGKPVERPPLPPHGPTFFVGYFHEPRADDTELPPLSFLSDSVRQRILDASQTIMVSAQLIEPHALIVQDQQERARINERCTASRQAIAAVFGTEITTTSKPRIRNPLDLQVPDDMLDRAYRVLNTIFQTIEHLGGHVAIDLVSRKTIITVLEYPIRIRMTGRDKCLTLSLREYPARRKTWRDTAHKQLEPQLGHFLVELFECAHRLKTAVQEQARTLRRRQQAEQQRQEHLRQQQEELARFDALERTAQNWHRARAIEAYIAELERRAADEPEHKAREALLDYIAWAREKVAWLDPLVKRDDPFLGENSGG